MVLLSDSRLPAPTLEPVVLDVEAPAHVPRHLVRDIRVALGLIPNELDEPYDPTLRLLEDDVPPLFFSPFPHTHVMEGTWVVTRFKDISTVYQNSELYSNAGGAAFQRLVGEMWPAIPLGIDPPDHERYRRFLNPWFTARAVGEMGTDIRALVDETIDSFAEARGGDIAWDFARVFPVRVFLKLMGLPFSMFEQFLQWEYEILHSHDYDTMKQATSAILAYLRSFIAARLAEPDDSLTSRIVNGSINDVPLTDDERIGTIFLLWLGGLDTVASTLSQMFRRLALDHALQNRLRAQPSLIPGAVEEFLRMQPLVNSVRMLKQDLELHGVQMRKGDHVKCLTTVGNFDPEAFRCPREFDPERKANRHFTLASGPHICLGAHLARLELKTALEQWLARVPTFSLAAGASRAVVPGLLSVRNLEICW